jgi:hypothetical protein
MLEQTEKLKLTEQELQDFKNIHQEYQNALFNVGLIAIDLENLTKEKNRLVEEVLKINERRLEIVKELGDKYGDKQVNLETGELE